MERKSYREISSSSSSDEKADPDYRQLQRKNSTSKSRNANLRIEMEAGPSSRHPGMGRRRGRTSTRTARGEGLPSSRRRSTRRTSANAESKSGRIPIKRDIWGWLIDAKAIKENNSICCVNETEGVEAKEGIIKKNGILCDCCRKIFTALGFADHSGSDLQKPYQNILVEVDDDKESWWSLLSCMSKAWNETAEIRDCKSKKCGEGKDSATDNAATDRHDAACMVCANGGNLLCCEICPSTNHQGCLQLEVAPEGDWLCTYCVCKFCGDRGAADDLLNCFQCDKKYHWRCYQERNSGPVDLNSRSTPLCEKSCKKVYEKLEMLVGVRQEIAEGFSWTLLRRMDVEFGIWLTDLYRATECQAKLAVAKNVMEECFEPIVDRLTRINVIRNVMYNLESDYPRVNFRGFYSAILEKDEEIISVASVRIHGTEVAEMPLIATRERHRSIGMCGKLMAAIEAALCSLGVENLVIPSIVERKETWIQRYGFQDITPSLSKELTHRNTLTFHDSVRLEKTLPAPEREAENVDHPIRAHLDLNSEPPEEEINEARDIATSSNPQN